MTSLIISGIVIVLLAVVILLALRTGRQAAEKDAAENNADVKDKQLRAALERPDKAGVIERLKRGKF